MTTYNYTVNDADYMTLETAIRAVLTIEGLSVNGDDVNVVATGLTGGNVTTLDAIMSGFNPVSLAVNKSNRMSEVKLKTAVLIEEGFTTSGGTFSLSRQDLVFYRMIRDSVNDTYSSLPVCILDVMNNTINFTLIGGLDTLVEVGEARLETIINGQHTLIDSINGAANQTALDAITDSRV